MRIYHAVIKPKDGVLPTEDQCGMVKTEMIFTIGDNAYDGPAWQGRHSRITAEAVIQRVMYDLHIVHTCEYQVTDITDDDDKKSQMASEDPEAWAWL